MVVEDAGDTLHTQRNALDSGYVFDTRYHSGTQPIHFLAEGRDASATLDALLPGTPSFQNEGDNDITGIHVSDGDPGVSGLLGAKLPRPFKDGWRVFIPSSTVTTAPGKSCRPADGQLGGDDDNED